MKPTDFTNDANGRVIKTMEGFHAFAPDPLPPVIQISWQLVALISEADRALSELAGVGRTLPNPHLLIGPFIRRESVASSRIEGTQAGLSDLLQFEASPSIEKQVPDVREVRNHVQALEYGLERLKTLPVSLRLIREIHEKLMHGVRGQNRSPGEFRRTQNWIGPPHCSAYDATYVPPPVQEMKTALEQLETYLHQSDNLPPLVRMALVHYQFEAIHPFIDGNGRIGRLLIVLLLCSEKILTQPLLYLSSYFDRHREDYYRLLLAVSRKGAWAEWIEFFLTGMARQARDAIERSNQLMDLWQSYRQRFQAARGSALKLQVIDQLFMTPWINAAECAKRLSVTPAAAQKHIEDMVQAGILKEVTQRKRNRIYMATEIVKIAERD